MATPDIVKSQAEVDLDHRTGYLIKRVSTSMRWRLDAALRSVDLTLPQYACMHILLENPGISGAELARRTFVSRQTAHELLGDLRARGWVTSQPSEDDKRSGVIHLTEEGREVFMRGVAPVAEVEAALVAALGADRAKLEELLLLCDDALNEIRE